MKVLIAGDLVINRKYNADRNIDTSVKDLFSQSDFNIVNLEAPITYSNSKIIKTGPHLKANKKSTLNVLKNLKIDAVTLANNHILDYDERGLKETLSVCKENNIKTVGAGKNLKEASKTLYIDYREEGKIAVINFAENEWASATEMTAGANPMDIIDNANQIKKAKEKANFVFVIIHGGHEYYNLPSPRMQKQYRYYADQGADLVVGHHTHCISGYEIYNEVPIYYSLGNFLFLKEKKKSKSWYSGLVLEIQLSDSNIRVNIHNVEQSGKEQILNLVKGKKNKNKMDKIAMYNNIIDDRDELSKKWKNYINEKTNKYLTLWSPHSYIKNKFISALVRRIPIQLINKKGLKLYLNLMRCEAHSDLSQAILKRYLKK